MGKYVIIAPGRGGAEWLQTEAQIRGLKTVNNPVDIGVRVELLASVMEKLTKALYEPKLVYYSRSFDDQVRTFCVSPYGEVTTESYDGVLTVNGGSQAETKTANTNFAILVSTQFTEPFKEPIAYGKYIARLSNFLAEASWFSGWATSTMADAAHLNGSHHSVLTPTLKNATPGDLSFVLPYRYLTDIREMLEALDKIAPGVASPETLALRRRSQILLFTSAAKQCVRDQNPEHVHHRRRRRRHTRINPSISFRSYRCKRNS